MKPLYSDIMLELHVPAFQPVKDFYGSLGYEVVWEKPTVDDNVNLPFQRTACLSVSEAA